MAFLKDIKRRSRSSFRTKPSKSSATVVENSPTPSAAPLETNGTNGNVSSDNPSSTTDSSSYSSKNGTPPPSLRGSNTFPTNVKTNGHAVPLQRPVPIAFHSSRSNSTGSNAVLTNGGSPSPKHRPTSIYAPKVLSISENSWVNQKVLLIYGQIGDARVFPLDGSVSVTHVNDASPSIAWPVSEGHFKALVNLAPGPNMLRLDFFTAKLGDTMAHSSWISINYLPTSTTPPLQLVILVGKDYCEGAKDYGAQRDSLEVVIKKFRMAAYLWQAFTAEQMCRHKFGRRSFRFEEEWQTGTLNSQDAVTGVMRNEAKVHVVRCEKTVEELRQIQNVRNNNDDGLASVAMDAIEKHFNPLNGQKQYVAALFLDTMWVAQAQKPAEHANATYNKDGINLAIFGPHGLHSYPSCLEEVGGAFTNCTRLDIDAGGSHWESASYAIGSQLHELGHMFGCTHQEDGVMKSDYTGLNRTFTIRESYSARTKSPGLKVCLPSDELGLHRLDALRLRFHPCFRLPNDPPPSTDGNIHAWLVDNGKILVASAAGIAFIEIFAGDEELCGAFTEYVNEDYPKNGKSLVAKFAMFTVNDIRQQLLESNRKAKVMDLKVHSGSLKTRTLNNIGSLKPKKSTIKISGGKVAYRDLKFPFSQHPDSVPEELILDYAFTTKLLTTIKIYYGLSICGLEFCYEDATSQVFGKREGNNNADFFIDARRGETLFGFYLNTSVWLDGIEILTSFGRKSGVFGNVKPDAVSSRITLLPPPGFGIAGISGSAGPYIETMSLVITR